jgi:hypothetical protein
MAKLGENLNDEQIKKLRDGAKPYPNKGTKVPGRQFERRLPNGMPAETLRYPKHVNRATLLARNNAEFKRLLSLIIIRAHKNSGEIKDDAKCYVKFAFNKYSIRVDGLSREYSMRSALFVTCYAAAILALNEYAQDTLVSYINEEFDENPLTKEALDNAQELIKQVDVIPNSLNEETVEEPEK